MKILIAAFSILVGPVVILSSAPALADDKPPPPAETESFYWYDGDVQRTMNLQESDDDDDPGSGADLVFTLGGQKISLPGGVIVRFRADWNPETIRQWLGQQGFTQYRAILSGHTWKIETEAGMPALETANRLHESGEVVYASPDWVREKALR